MTGYYTLQIATSMDSTRYCDVCRELECIYSFEKINQW